MRERTTDIAQGLDEILTRLPADVTTAHHGPQRLVASTAGVFVLDPMVDGDELTRGTAARLATVTRETLAMKLRWVPFVDWFVVTDAEPRGSLLPTDLVHSTVLEGRSVDESTALRIAALLAFGDLTPPWQPGIPAKGATGGGMDTALSTPRG